MNKFFFVLLFIGFFHLYANGSCQDAWNTNQDLKKEEELSSEIVRGMFEHFYTKMEDMAPDINIAEIKISQGAFGRMFDHLNSQDYLIGRWLGKWGERKVFLKKIQKPRGEEELAVMRTLRRIGIPVLFEGVVQNKDGTLYMVNLFLDSPLFKSEAEAFQYFPSHLHPKIRQQLEQIHALYSKYGIFPRDFQFMVSKKAGVVYVVDGEFYMFLGAELEGKKSDTRTKGRKSFIKQVKKFLKR